MENIFEHINRDFSPSKNLRYGVDTKSAPITCILPTGMPAGFSVFFADWSGTFGQNNFTIKTNSHTINDSATTLVVDTTGDSIGLFWTGTTWRTYE